jgi:hypothetical protein
VNIAKILRDFDRGRKVRPLGELKEQERDRNDGVLKKS